jgi:hypothetical protein
VYTYHIGGPLQSLHFIWRVGHTRDENAHARNITVISGEKLQFYYGRQLLKQFEDRFSLLNVSPTLMKNIFAYLTHDRSAPNDISEKNTQIRLQIILDGGLESALIVPDLRELGEGPTPKYDEFWETLEEVLSERTRVDDRRHGTNQHFSVACSARSLHEETVKKLLEKQTEGDEVSFYPSFEWMRLQFSPACLVYGKSAQHTGRFAVQYHVQRRTLRVSHMDAKYCFVLQKYQQEHVIQHAGDIEYVMIDDKANIAVGKPGCPVATVSRGRKVMSLKVSCYSNSISRRGGWRSDFHSRYVVRIVWLRCVKGFFFCLLA